MKSQETSFPLSPAEHQLLDAALWHDCAAIRKLVSTGVDVNVRSEGGNGVLIRLIQQPPEAGDADDDAFMFGHLARFIEDPVYQSTPEEIETLRWLVAHGLRLDMTDAAGATALACAVYGDNRPAVDFLLAAGADTLDFGDDSLSPFDIAVREDRHELLARFLERARGEGRLAAIDADPRHGRWIDEASGETAQMLEAAFGRAGKEARAKVRVLQDARELEDEAPAPVTLYFNRQDEAIFSSGAILKLCPRCNYSFRNFFNYNGSRYGMVGNYQCPRCLTWYILHDNDLGGSPIYYKIHDDSDYVTLTTLDYTRLYRLDALPAIVARHAPGLLDDLHDRSHVSLSEVMDRLRATLGAAPEEPADRRLEGGHVPPPEVAAWLGWVERLQPQNTGAPT